MSEEHRVKIQNSNILNALIEHVEGKREMSSTQVSAGLGLLKKALPDLSNIVLEGPGDDGEHTVKHEASFAEFASLLGRIASIKSGGTESEG